MSSSYISNHHDSTHCTSCGKKKAISSNMINTTDSKNESTTLNHPSISALLDKLTLILNQLEQKKLGNHPDKEKNHWTYEDKKDTHVHMNHDCKCKKHHSTHQKHDWLNHNDKQDAHHKKHDCKCKSMHYTDENLHHIELKPLLQKLPHEFTSFESSSIDFHFEPYKENHRKHCPCKCHQHNHSHMYSESSSVIMHVHSKEQQEVPQNIWLSDILSLLYENNLLNLDNLFDQLNAKGHLPKGQPCNCHKEHSWSHDTWHSNDSYEYSKEYYYNGIPLKRLKRKSFPFKKYK